MILDGFTQHDLNQGGTIATTLHQHPGSRTLNAAAQRAADGAGPRWFRGGAAGRAAGADRGPHRQLLQAPWCWFPWRFGG